MSFLSVVITILAVVLLITGGMVEALRFLIWVALVLFVVAIIAFLLRSISGRR